MKLKIDTPTKPIRSDLFFTESGFSLVQEGNDFFIIGEATEKQLLDAFSAHNAPALIEPTIAEKLASVGLSVDDLKAALGL
jgi:hypothetical protein